MTKPLLIEIGVEELPAIPLLKIIKNIEKSWENILKEYRVDSQFEFLYTPRRLVLKHQDMSIKQQDSTTELFGPPLAVAIKDNKPTKAGEGFARKCGVAFEELERTQKNGKEILYYKKEELGRDTKELLQEMIDRWIASMSFGKMMRWGSRSDEFIRPVRWLQVRLGDESIDIELFGVKSGIKTFVHRMVSFEPIEVKSIDDYENILAKGNVSLYPKDREEKILKEFDELEKEHNITIQRDKALLSEVVAITENPKALLGSFDKLFLELPPEAIIASMKEHQRYFPVFEDNKLSNKFIVVSNAVTDDYTKVIEGNERVLKPRLSDGLFFYQNDLKRGLVTDGLEKITFMDGLGSLMDKIDREKAIAIRLLSLYMDRVEQESGKNSSELTMLMEEAITLAKADLTSEMVYEFTELQGLMGYYYAKALGKDELVYNAIKEQYYPLGDGAKLPSSIFSSIVSMAIKIDTLIGLFSIGKIPTGSKDPFALRRAVNGIIRMVIEYDLAFDIDNILELTNELYGEYDKVKLIDFILERIYKSLDANASIISAVLSSNERDINEIAKKVEALKGTLSKERASLFKRVANISKDISLNSDPFDRVEIELFENKLENELYIEIKNRKKEYSSYEELLISWFSLEDLLDRYFRDIMVNVEDKNIRFNRQNLIASIYFALKNIADIKEISV